MVAGKLDLLSVAGRQVLGGFWERVIQPQIFWMLGSRYGATESINRTRRVQDKIANGQCIFVRRAAYESMYARVISFSLPTHSWVSFASGSSIQRYGSATLVP